MKGRINHQAKSIMVYEEKVAYEGKRGKRGPTKTKKGPAIHSMKVIKPNRNLKKCQGLREP